MMSGVENERGEKDVRWIEIEKLRGRENEVRWREREVREGVRWREVERMRGREDDVRWRELEVKEEC